MNSLALLVFFTCVLFAKCADITEEAPAEEANKLVKDLYNSHEKLRSELAQIRGDIDNTLTILSSIYDILSPSRRNLDDNQDENSYRYRSLYDDDISPQQQINKAMESLGKIDPLNYMRQPLNKFRGLEDASSVPMYGLVKTLLGAQRSPMDYIPQMGSRMLNTFTQPISDMRSSLTRGLKTASMMNN